MMGEAEHWQNEIRLLLDALRVALREHDAGCVGSADPWVAFSEMRFRVTRSLMYCALATRRFIETGRGQRLNGTKQDIEVLIRMPTGGAFHFEEAWSGNKCSLSLNDICDELIHNKYFEFKYGVASKQENDDSQIFGFVVASGQNYRKRALDLDFEFFINQMEKVAMVSLAKPHKMD